MTQEQQQLHDEFIDFMLNYPVNPNKPVPDEKIIMIDFILKKTKGMVTIEYLMEITREDYQRGYDTGYKKGINTMTNKDLLFGISMMILGFLLTLIFLAL